MPDSIRSCHLGIYSKLPAACLGKGYRNRLETPVFMEDPSFRAELGVDPEKMVVGLLHIGYPMEIPKVNDIKTKVEIRD
ncbi:MAG: hypothetical protein ACQEV7_15440 [Bacillota bacterium]